MSSIGLVQYGIVQVNGRFVAIAMTVNVWGVYFVSMIMIVQTTVLIVAK